MGWANRGLRRRRAPARRPRARLRRHLRRSLCRCRRLRPRRQYLDARGEHEHCAPEVHDDAPVQRQGAGGGRRKWCWAHRSPRRSSTIPWPTLDSDGQSHERQEPARGGQASGRPGVRAAASRFRDRPRRRPPRSYDPFEGGLWSPVGSMAVARGEFAGTLLPNGRVLAAGGVSENRRRDLRSRDPASGPRPTRSCRRAATPARRSSPAAAWP